MPRNLRISLTILSVGFAFEGGGEVYTRYVGGATAPSVNLLYVLPVVLSLVGLLFVWVGREEWNELHRVRVSMASRVFAVSLLGGLVAAVDLGVLVADPALGTPPWAAALFGAAIGSLVFGTFVTYAYLVFHLTSNPGRTAVLVALAWAFVISVAVAVAIAAAMSTILSIVVHQTLSVPAFVAPVDYLVSYLFISYFLLLAAYIEAHVAVARGLATVPNVAGEPVTR